MPTWSAPFALRAAIAVCALAGLAACTAPGQYSNAAFNVRQPVAALAGAPPRASFRIDGDRGNRRVLMMLALSGGGSRAAYMAAETMLALQQPQIGLLDEVDVISAVSGGSLAAAYYVASRDPVLQDADLAARLQTAGTPLDGVFSAVDGTLRCRRELTPVQRAALDDAVADAGDRARLVELCRAPRFPAWTAEAARRTMKRNYMLRFFGQLVYPHNLFRYWFSSFDRSDIMAATLADGALSKYGLRDWWDSDVKMHELNPLRPYLLINATNATQQALPDGSDDPFPFGSAFTFTAEDFQQRLASDIAPYSLSRAVMASSAFPLAFATMTLEDFRGVAEDAERPNPERRFVHLIDGGNSDNLGLRAVKRALLQAHADGRLDAYDRIIVLQVDAYTRPGGTSRSRPDPRSLIDLLLDTNVGDAVDSLLQANRDRLLGDFDDGRLRFGRECGAEKNAIRHFPIDLCERLLLDLPARELDLHQRLVFFHFGFADVVKDDDDAVGLALKRQLDLIPTSFSIDDSDDRLRSSQDAEGFERVGQRSATRLIRDAVARVIAPGHPCTDALVDLVRRDDPERLVTEKRVDKARQDCQRADRRK
jgi:NTE family protein